MAPETATDVIRVAVVDDHPLLREGLALVLDRDPAFELVAEVETAHDALSMIATVKPDVAVIDLNLPDGDGTDVCAHVQAEHPRVGLLVLSRSSGKHFVMKAFRSGADGYVVKSADPRHVRQAIKSVAAGESYIDPEVADYVINTATGGKRAQRPYGLTAQEWRVMDLVKNGSTNRQAAGELGISVETVKTHLRHAMKKLGAEDRRSAARILDAEPDEECEDHRP